MQVNVTKASEMTGKARTTLYKDMKRGNLSYDTDAKGNKKIDVSELERVYGLKKNDNDNEQPATQGTELAVLREKVSYLERERGRDQETIEDLRKRLDSEAEERRRLNALLTDQREHKTEQEATDKAQMQKAINELTQQQTTILKQLEEKGQGGFFKWLGFGKNKS